MKKAARITSKGQITVPHEIRRALGVRPGDKLLFEKDRVGVRVRPVRAKSPFEKYRGIGSQWEEGSCAMGSRAARTMTTGQSSRTGAPVQL